MPHHAILYIMAVSSANAYSALTHHLQGTCPHPPSYPLYNGCKVMHASPTIPSQNIHKNQCTKHTKPDTQKPSHPLYNGCKVIYSALTHHPILYIMAACSALTHLPLPTILSQTRTKPNTQNPSCPLYNGCMLGPYPPS